MGSRRPPSPCSSSSDSLDRSLYPVLNSNPFKYPREPENTIQISTWNLNGISGIMKDKEGEKWNFAFRKYIEAEDPHILVLTEVHKQGSEIEASPVFDWWKNRYPYRYWGGKTGVLSKLKPEKVTYGFPEGRKFDKKEAASRCIALEFSTIILLATYVPNSGDKFSHIDVRLAWDHDFRSHLFSLDRIKPVIWSGDFNVVRESSSVPSTSPDLAMNSLAWGKAGGTHVKEREALEVILAGGGNYEKREVKREFVDVWRFMRSEEDREYTHSSAKHGKWRLDGFILSNRLLYVVRKCEIRHEVWQAMKQRGVAEERGRMSDHWPGWISLELETL